MKQLKFIITFLCMVVLLNPEAFSQNTVDNRQNSDLIEQLGPQNYIFNFQVAQVPLNGTNSIYVEQIGSQNQLEVRSRTDTGNINLIQNGSNNITRIDVTTLSISDNIQQFGGNHFFAEYTNTPNLNMQRTINQTGNGQNLMIHGNNSLSDKMRLSMAGNSNTIIIRNFN